MPSIPKLVFAPFLLLLTLFTTACSSELALSHDMEMPPESKSLVLLSLHLENRVEPSHEATGDWLIVTRQDTGDDRHIQLRRPEHKEPDKSIDHLIVMDLDPGSYRVTKVNGSGEVPFVISYSFEVRPNTSFSLQPKSITYIGSLHLINRPRKENEERSGDLMPLVDQAVAGYSNGATDITVIDQSQTDIPDFLKFYPKLKGHEIRKSIMMPAK